MPLSLRTIPFLFSFSRGTLFVAVASVAVLFLAGLFVYQVQAWTLPQKGVAGGVSSGTVYLSATGQAEAAAAMIATREAPMREVHIANNGLVLLRGATVIEKSRSTIRVSMDWDSMNFTWTITTDSGTKFLTSKGQKAASENIEVGDVVMITGQLVKSGAEPTIDAQFVRKD